MFQEFKHILIIVLILFVGGSLGYTIVEEWNFFDALYMTIITLSTTGFEEIKPLSTAGRVFTMILIIFGISILFYAIGNLNIVIFERNIFRGRKMLKKINDLQNHYVVCGYGRMGKKISQELAKRNESFVIIEKNEKELEQCEDYLHIQGDSTEDSNLTKAGVIKAKGLVAVLKDDVANVFAVLSARGLNPNLKIIARAEEESSREKLIKAGANRVILPYEIGGFRITQALLKPTVVDYIDEIFSRSEIGLEMEEIKITAGSSLIGKSVVQSGIRDLNIIIIAIYRLAGELIYNPRSQTILNEGDTLIMIGEVDGFHKLQKIA